MKERNEKQRKQCFKKVCTTMQELGYDIHITKTHELYDDTPCIVVSYGEKTKFRFQFTAFFAYGLDWEIVLVRRNYDDICHGTGIFNFHFMTYIQHKLKDDLITFERNGKHGQKCFETIYTTMQELGYDIHIPKSEFYDDTPCIVVSYGEKTKFKFKFTDFLIHGLNYAEFEIHRTYDDIHCETFLYKYDLTEYIHKKLKDDLITFDEENRN
jgi:hypothetical protein